MFGSFMRRRRAGAEQIASVPPGVRVYAVGDIHGRADLLAQVAEQVQADLEVAPAQEALTVFVGDYIDRGLESAAVLRRLSASDFPTRFVALRGNHEAMLLQFVEDEASLERWRQFGAIETLFSLGIDVTDVMRGRGFSEAQAALKRALSDGPLEFLMATERTFEIGDYFFCHAGVKPGVPLAQQREEDLLWIRDEFIASAADFGKIVVHGHTPVEEPDVRSNRINIDTGAYATGKLTCLVLDGGTHRFITAR